MAMGQWEIVLSRHGANCMATGLSSGGVVNNTECVEVCAK